MKNIRPEGDIWGLKDLDEESQYFGEIFKFNFSFITSEEIKNIVKDYIWQNHSTGNNTLSTLSKKLYILRYFNSFIDKRNITSLKELTNTDIDKFVSYLRTTVSDTTQKPLSYQSQKKVLDALKVIIHWGQINKPEVVPDTEIFTGNEYTGVNHKLKIDFIPDKIISKINEELKSENNPYLKYGIIILELTGMRIGDLLKLRIDCIQPHLISGYTITWFDHKNRRERKPMPVKSECTMAVDKLIEITKDLREEADEKDKDTLLIYRCPTGKNAGKVLSLNARSFGESCKSFVQRNNIMDATGEYYNLTSHQFRRTLGTDMLSKGININVIQQVLGHADPSVTKRFYADVKDKERAEVFKEIGIIGNINKLGQSAFDSVTDMEWFKANKDKCVAGLCDGYCTKHLQNGEICDRLLKRQKCYTCNRYITTPEYLDAHKNHLASLERQLVEGAIYGEHYAEHFIPTIEVLKVIIQSLEGLQHD